MQSFGISVGRRAWRDYCRFSPAQAWLSVTARIARAPRGNRMSDFLNDRKPAPQARKILLVEDSFANRDM
jgi:hypothetical protein